MSRLVIDAAQVAVEDARTAFRRTQAAFAIVLRGELRAYLDRDPDRDEDDIAAEFSEVIAALYWDHDDIVRVADLTATTVLQTSRSEVPWALCSTCRAVEAAARAVEAAAGPYLTDRPWDFAPWADSRY